MEELVVFGLRTKMGIPYHSFEHLTQGDSLDDVSYFFFFFVNVKKMLS